MFSWAGKKLSQYILILLRSIRCFPITYFNVLYMMNATLVREMVLAAVAVMLLNIGSKCGPCNAQDYTKMFVFIREKVYSQMYVDGNTTNILLSKTFKLLHFDSLKSPNINSETFTEVNVSVLLLCRPLSIS